ALIFDSKYNNFRGVISSIRVTNGTIRTGDMITFMATGRSFQVEEIGVFTPAMSPVGELGPGEVGYLIPNIKTVDEARVGDTITSQKSPALSPLPGYRKVKPVVFCGFYPIERDEFPQLRDALEKLQMNDSAIFFEPETSTALGFGFRCGFLGLLHMEIARERLNREFGVDLVATAPNVVYQVLNCKGEITEAHRPADFPEQQFIDEVREPFIKVTSFVPSEYVGKVMQLCQDRRGVFGGMDYITPQRARIVYEIPLAEFIIDFHDRLKSATRGFASLDYEHSGFRASDLVKVDLLIGGDPIDAFCFVCHSSFAYNRGQEVVRKLKEIIPRQMFEVSLQAAIGKKVIVRQNVKPLRKDVLAKCYGGDITRKRKLLEKQKEGKKKMKQIGRISLPQEAFLAFLKTGDEEED
ncbi:MAG TPA: elongation factor 4, partial [Synergistetes bacterium]|nr:elongation factor 4 [Synergistota bacterium]